MTDEQRKAHIQALLQERDGYERKGDAARVEQVSEQLRHFGHEGAPPHRKAEQRPPASERR